jgi:hypothetical protein
MDARIFTENLEDSLTRLKRHYDICVAGYDRAALKDLAHVLRVWADMKMAVDKHLQLTKPTQKFTAFSLTREFKRMALGYSYLAVGFFKGVTVNASSSELGGQIILGYKGSKVATEVSAGTAIIPMDGNKRLMRSLVLIHKSLSDEEHKVIHKKTFETTKVRFAGWMDGLAIQFNTFNEKSLDKYQISRENMIRRVANVLGGSHPISNEYIRDEDVAIAELMNYVSFEIPIPYFVLVKIAQDILEAFDVETLK